MSHIINGSTTAYPLPYDVIPYDNGSYLPDEDMVLGDNGTVFATDNSGSVASEPVLFAFDETSGAIEWTYQQPVDQLALVAASSGGGVVAKSTTNGIDTVLRFDSSGNVTPDTWTAPDIINFGGDFWLGNSPSGGTTSGYSAAAAFLGASPWVEPEGIGGKAAKQRYSVPDFSQTGPNETVIMGDVREILTALPLAAFPGSSSCNAWVQSGPQGADASQLLQALFTQVNPMGWGHGTVKINGNTAYTVHAFSGNVNADGSPVAGVPNNVATTVNDSGGFFNSNYPNFPPYNGRAYAIGIRNYPGDTLRAQATTLLHELGHVVLGAEPVQGTVLFQNDSDDPAAEVTNDTRVDTHCRQMIEALPSITSLSRPSGQVGTPVTVTGTNLGANQGTSTIAFNGIAAAPTSWTVNNHGVTTIVVPVPSGATTGVLVITVSGVPTTGPSFTVSP
jgi:hypothetical protein